MPRNMLIVSYVETIWHPKSTISESTCTPWNIGNVPSLLDWMLNKTALPCLPVEQRVDSKLSKFLDPTILQVIFLENLSKTIHYNLSKLDWIFFSKREKMDSKLSQVPGSIDFRGKFPVALHFKFHAVSEEISNKIEIWNE